MYRVAVTVTVTNLYNKAQKYKVSDYNSPSVIQLTIIEQNVLVVQRLSDLLY